MIYVRFETHDDSHPDVEDGPFEWVETLDGSLAGMRPDGDEADELAFITHGADWMVNGARYRRLTIYTA